MNMKERQDGKTLEAIGHVLKGLGMLAHMLGDWMIDYMKTKEANNNERDERNLAGDQRAEEDGAGPAGYGG